MSSNPLHRFALALGCTAALGCSDGRTPVVVYSPHGRDLLAALEKAYEAENPTIDIRWLDMGSQEVYDRVRSERANAQADVWFGGPDAIFGRGDREGLLEAFTPSWSNDVPPESRGASGTHFGCYRTLPVLVYNSAAVPEAEAPADWDDLLAERWKGKVIVRDPLASGTMRSMFAMVLAKSVAETGDTSRGFAWLKRLDGQTKEYASNPALLFQKIVRREGLVTVWELSDILLQQKKGIPVGFKLASSGTPVINDAIGLVKGAPHAEAARAYINWVGGREAQVIAARQAFKLPARTDLPADSLPDWAQRVLATLRPAPLDWSLVEREQSAWMAQWDREVRGKGGLVTERDTSESPAFLEVRGLRKRFGEREVLQDFSLDVASGEILALLGVSGSGKTTALRLLAGLDAPDGGRVLLGGDDVTELPAARRGVGMVFQHYALFPHLTIGENVSFGLEGRGLGRDEVRRRAEEALVQVRLPGHFDGKVGALSGGMQQRVAIARALAPAPRVLLLDEPFSNLDPQLREYTRRELRDTIRRIGITTVLVTHEQEEAFDVADRVALLVGGRLEQVGTPEDLYERPRTLAVGAFIGRSALLAGPFVESADSGDAGVRIRPDLVWSGVRAEAIGVGEPAAILLRPESLRFVEPGDASALPGVVESRRFAGPRSYFRVALEGGIAGETVEVLARTGAVAIGERVAVAPDPKGSPPQIFVAPAKRVGS